MVLQFIDAEKSVDGKLVFPSFNLTIKEGQVIAIHTDVEIREQVMKVISGKTKLTGGDFIIEANERKIGYYFLEAFLYERLKVEEMLQFIQNLYHSEISISDVLEWTQLASKKHLKINQLSYSEKKRVQLANLLIQDCKVYIFEEPDQNLSLESFRILLTILDKLRQSEKSVLLLTSNLESAITVSDQVFKLTEEGLVLVQIKSEDSENDEVLEQPEELTQISLDKIPSKVNDKIVLFHPPEIDYIESHDGQSNLFVNGETFPCTLTLQKLEERLIPYGFFRCHRSYIVNLQKVREVITWTRNSYSLVLENKQKSTIPLSKSKMTELKEMIGL